MNDSLLCINNGPVIVRESYEFKMDIVLRMFQLESVSKQQTKNTNSNFKLKLFYWQSSWCNKSFALNLLKLRHF